MTGKEFNSFITDVVKEALTLLKKNKNIIVKIDSLEYLDEVVSGTVVANTCFYFEYPKKSEFPGGIVFDIEEWETADLALQDGLRHDVTEKDIFTLMPEEKLLELKVKLPERTFLILCAALKIYAHGLHWRLI